MKRMFLIAAALIIATPLSAHAQERMSDARYLAANRCLAYAELDQLQADGANFSALRDAADAGGRLGSVRAEARTQARDIRARANGANVDELRERRDETCASFVQHGLVQLNDASAS
ncbi:hypothetical protein [Vitreimonas flagellata]|uniref:hypothetical protein n=1 Tax=Vitreimonas flagellata TaxID=2560861 RepID=UPI00107574C8|nr:hypothetical protein [Vitreimonas flagellata]